MDADQLRQLLERVSSGEVSVAQASEKLSSLPFADLGFARLDHHRAVRQGVPEVVFGEGKTTEQILAITDALAGRDLPVLLTRLASDAAEQLRKKYPEAMSNPLARTFRLQGSTPAHRRRARLAVVTAGTSDLPIAQEAMETLNACGIEPDSINDVGVAGLHRLLAEVERLRTYHGLIVVAGMEGALASVVGGIVHCPVIAVPTSVGYGAALQGMTALMGMLTSCASGVTVVNVDNGFGAAIASVRLIDQLFAVRDDGATP